MKKLLKRIGRLNSKHWRMVLEYDPVKYQVQYDAYMADLEKVIQQYVISHCDCTEEETTGCISEYVCNNCGRTQRT